MKDLQYITAPGNPGKLKSTLVDLLKQRRTQIGDIFRDFERELGVSLRPLSLSPLSLEKGLITFLDLSDCKLTALPPAVYEMASLVSLHCANNSISSLNPGITKLQKLEIFEYVSLSLLAPPV